MIYRYFILSKNENNEINAWIKDNLTQRYRLYYLKDRDCFGIWTYKRDAVRLKLRWSGDNRFSDILPLLPLKDLESEIVRTLSMQITAEIDNQILAELQNFSLTTATNKTSLQRIKEMIFDDLPRLWK